MNAGEMWDVRLPDGRGLRAVTTETICEYLRAGRLPREALVRRAGHDDWTTLDWVPEFAALLAERPPPATPAASKTSPGPRTRQGPQDDPTATVTSRLETTHLGALGVPVILREVVTALDLTLLPNKLRLLAVLGLLAGLLVTLPALVWAPPDWFLWVQLGGAFLLLAFGSIALSQLAYAELARNRRARWTDARKGILGRTLRLAFGLLLVPGLGATLVIGLCWLSRWLLNQHETDVPPGFVIGAWTAASAALVLAIPVLSLGPMALMLAPILVIEECGLFQAIGQWMELLRHNLARALLYDLLATGVMLFFLVIPSAVVSLLSWLPLEEPHRPLILGLQGMLWGMLAALFLAYLVVVQVFLYLNLRFDVTR